ncbi:outer membrane lipoprotein LolB [Sulfuritortus calidifontis]|uniref:Outer-membrane lipoprotein LolB n=1 Tax=Sulfuritortus calidifontis TaxID=1914471 RepID=A0A4R3K0J7_9PROT|nr:lipoprotein insertase outer membrane protein LolB [Sulfuritortus calidifontis]TCS73481.1 outer membrane lipoprotein LolB [Sulfuritortus calidifontis]
MLRALAGLGALAWLTACAPLPPIQAAAPEARPQPTAEAFHLEGRVSVRSAGQQFAGGIVWTRQGERQEILLRTPLGQGVAEVRLGPAGASLTDGAGNVREAADGEALLQEAIGVALPLAGLGHWLRGRPDPARPFAGVPDGQGGWASLEQDGWRIEYGSVTEAGLPSRLTAWRGDDLEIRLVVDAWQAP